MTKLATLMFVLAAAAGCKKKEAAKVETTGSATGSAMAGSGSAMVGSAMAGSGSAEGSGSAAAAAWDGKTPLPLTEGFQTPESVLYVADADLYLVSNINGVPLGADDNGYISKIDPETGKVTEAKWIDGAKDNIKLDAPKGMAIASGVLYVADINTVRKFDAKTGEPKGDIKIEGATFLNDMAVAADGGVYVTDSGLDEKFGPTKTDAIYHIGEDGKVKPLIKDPSLANPNGIIAGENMSVWVVTFGSGEIYQVDNKGKKAAGQKLPKGQLDGIVALDGGEYLVSSWEGSEIFRGKPGGEWKPVVENVKSPADIGWDLKRKRVLIPIFQGNSVILQPLQ